MPNPVNIGTRRTSKFEPALPRTFNAERLVNDIDPRKEPILMESTDNGHCRRKNASLNPQRPGLLDFLESVACDRE
jgi:hypothetical protein